MMESKMHDMLEKAKATAMTAATAAGKAADSATRMAGGLFETTKLNLQVFDLNTDIELLFKEIGKAVYLTHTGAAADAEEINDKIAVIDGKYAKIRELKAQIEERRDTLRCPSCGAECAKEDVYCRVCGQHL
jgi:hypothetical protein